MIFHAKHYATAEPVAVTVEGGAIAAVTPSAENPRQWVAPAFFDPQINGCLGVAFNSPSMTPEQVHTVAAALPRLDRLLSGAAFDPSVEDAAFRIAVSDNASQVVCPLLCQMILPYSERVSCQFVPLHEGTFDAMERGRLDLALNADDGHTPDRFHREVIYDDDFVCVVAKASRYSGRLTLKQYLAGLHVGVGVLTGRQTIPEQRLAALGKRRTCAIEVPFFTAAIRCVAGTSLIATVPRRLAELERHDPAIKFVRPPAEMQGFRYLMIWHPRLHTDQAHVWLRSMIAAAGRELGGLAARGRGARQSVPKTIRLA